MKTIDGKDKNLADFKGKVVLIVNTASLCGHTPQYRSLKTIYKHYKDQGFVVLAFPENNFKNQEPGTNEEIKKSCDLKYHKVKWWLDLVLKLILWTLGCLQRSENFFPRTNVKA